MQELKPKMGPVVRRAYKIPAERSNSRSTTNKWRSLLRMRSAVARPAQAIVFIEAYVVLYGPCIRTKEYEHIVLYYLNDDGDVLVWRGPGVFPGIRQCSLLETQPPSKIFEAARQLADGNETPEIRSVLSKYQRKI